jgi:hypothetical protein
MSSNSTEAELVHELKRKSGEHTKEQLKESFSLQKRNDSIDLDKELLPTDEFAADESHISDIFKTNLPKKYLIPSLKKVEKLPIDQCRPRSISTFPMMINGLFQRNHKKQHSNAQPKDDLTPKVKTADGVAALKLKINKTRTKEQCMKIVKAIETKGFNKFCNTAQPPKKDSETLIDIEENRSIFRRRPNLSNMYGLNISERMEKLGRSLAT